MSVYEAKYMGSYQFTSDVDLKQSVHLFTSVVAKNGQLINKGDYLSFDMDEEVGYLLIHYLAD